MVAKMRLMFSYQIREQRAFTLVEMAIVVVIISLLLSLVVKGNTLVESAKIRTVISEVNSYKTAINSFSAKYIALPGDFNDATSYWNNASVKNGNGDGKISFQNNESIYEGYNAWQHLSNEHMLDQAFLGTATTNVPELNIDIPRARVGGGYFLDSGLINDAKDANVIALGLPTAPNTTAQPYTIGFAAGLIPSQAHDIDVKIDDGNPTTGMVRGTDGNVAKSCVDKASQYVISSKEVGCKMVFRIGGK